MQQKKKMLPVVLAVLLICAIGLGAGCCTGARIHQRAVHIRQEWNLEWPQWNDRVQALLFRAAWNNPYEKAEILGTNSRQIQERYGTFWSARGKAGQDGLYRGCTCAYQLSEPFGQGTLPMPGVMLSIDFDENGIACRARIETYAEF